MFEKYILNLENHYFTRLFIYLFTALLISFSYGMTMGDDGLRHIAFAYNGDVMKDWGSVYPHSLFGTYDPWYLWHKMIGMLSPYVDMHLVHLIINLFVLFIFMLLIDALLKRYIGKELGAYIVVFTIMIASMSDAKYVVVRPDLLSGFYILAMLSVRDRVTYVVALTLLYAPTYYLFFLYTGSMGLVFIAQKKYKLLMGTFIASCIALFGHIALSDGGYIHTVTNILNDQALRGGLAVHEGLPLFNVLGSVKYYLAVPITFGAVTYLIYRYYSYLKDNGIALFLLLTMVLWLFQIRYFILFLPLFYILALIALVQTDKMRLLAAVRQWLNKTLKSIPKAKASAPLLVLAIFYAIILYQQTVGTSVHDTTNKSYAFLREGNVTDGNYTNATILSNTLSETAYFGPYNNPTLHLVPSCSIGWFDDNSTMKELYVDMMQVGISEEEIVMLVKYVDADFFFFSSTDTSYNLNVEKMRSLGLEVTHVKDSIVIFKRNRGVL